MIRTLAACAVILALLLGGIYVNSLYQTFRRRHPELGPFRRLDRIETGRSTVRACACPDASGRHAVNPSMGARTLKGINTRRPWRVTVFHSHPDNRTRCFSFD